MANIPLQTIKYPGLPNTYTIPQIDDTLEVTGAAADAKKVGDEIAELKDDLSDISEGGTEYIYTPLTYDSINFDRTRQGIRFIQKTDGTVDVSGTNDGTGNSLLGLQDSNGIHFFSLSASKTYRLTGCPAGGSVDGYYLNIRKSSGGSLFFDFGSGVIFSPPDDDSYQIVVAVNKNYAVSGTKTFTPLLEEREEVTSQLTAVDQFARKGLGLFDNKIVTPQMFGAVANGSTDDSQAVSQADAHSGSSVVFFPPGVYNVSGVTAHKSWIMSDGAWITTTSHNGVPITIAGNGNTYKLNCDYTGINPSRGVLVTGNKNHIEQIIVKGMVYDSTNSFGSAGLLVTGNYNTVDFARFYDFINDQGDNDSAPQGAALLDDATGNHFADIYTYNVRAGFVNAANSGTTNSIGIIKNENSHDNAVYCVRGGHMNIGNIIHDGNDEGLCVITDTGTDLTTVDVGTLFCKNVVMGVRIKNAGVVRIGNVFLEDCKFGLRLDYANESSEALIIDNFEMKGEMQAPFIFQNDGNRGELGMLRINNMNIEHESIPSDSPTTYLQYYMRLDTVEELFIGNCNVKMSQEVEEHYDSGSILMTVKSSLPKKSYIGDVTLDCGDRTVTVSPIQQNLSVKNGTVSGTSVVIDNKSVKRGGLCANAVPQSGYWENGQMLKALSNNNVGFYYCIASGTPGTWKSIQLT